MKINDQIKYKLLNITTAVDKYVPHGNYIDDDNDDNYYRYHEYHCYSFE